MIGRQKQCWSFIAFPLAGLLSALFPVCFDLHRMFGDKLSMVFASGSFGGVNAVCMYYFLNLRPIVKIAIFIIVSFLASLLSVVGVGFVCLSWPLFQIKRPLVEPAAFFAGGFVSAFILLFAVLWLGSSSLNSLKLSRVCPKVFSGALVGGFLGSLGRAAGGLAYQIRLYFPSIKSYGSDSDVSLVIIWQTGMAFIPCYFLWVERKHVGERSFGMRQGNISL